MTFFDVYAFIALFTFFSLLISKSMLTHLRGERVFFLGKGKQGFARWLEFSFYLGCLFLIYLVIISALNLSFLGRLDLIILFQTLFTDLIGFLLLNMSIILFALALAGFKDAWKIGVYQIKEDHLITTGIFKYTRNPVYLAIIFLFGGYFLLYSNFFFLGSLIFITLAMHYQILKEEKLLRVQFKEVYQTYYRKTPRYLFLRRHK